jgi:[CysO sulfur-carrier protein]-S-L-cysteine hydrolase
MPQFNRLDIPDALLKEMIEHGRGELPFECCGLLAGRIVEGVGIATSGYQIANDAASPRAYLTNARDMFDAFRKMRKSGLELLAMYHSHPSTQPVPSAADIEQNNYGETIIHLILSLEGKQPVIRAWWIMETGYREAEWRGIEGV